MSVVENDAGATPSDAIPFFFLEKNSRINVFEFLNPSLMKEEKKNPLQGVQSVKKRSDLNPRYIFVKPPSMEILEQRLRGRGTETEDKILTRLANASKELEYGDGEGNFHRVIVNDDLDRAYSELRAALHED